MSDIYRRQAITAAVAALGLVALGTDSVAQPGGDVPSSKALPPLSMPTQPPPPLHQLDESQLKENLAASIRTDIPLVVTDTLFKSESGLPFDRGDLGKAWNETVQRLRSRMLLPDLSTVEPQQLLGVMGSA